MGWPHRNRPSKSHSNPSNSCLACNDKLKLAHPLIKEWWVTHVVNNWQDVHISWTYRGKVDQEKAFNEKKSQLHFPDSPHNQDPSKAIDLFQIDGNGKGIWNPDFFTAVNKYNVNNSIQLRWGGDFKDFKDYCHFEL